MKVVVAGGGVAGFSAAMVARKTGAEVTLIERTDMLGGLAMVAGMGLGGFWENSLYQERALGGADIADIFESITTHGMINIPGHPRLLCYNVTKLDARMQKALKEKGIEYLLTRKVTGIQMTGDHVDVVTLEDGTKVSGDAFVDATGTAVGVAACEKWGFGCVGCILRCPTFGNPGGLVDKKGNIKTFNLKASDGKTGIIGTSVMLPIASLSDKLQKEVNEKGFTVSAVPAGVEPDWARYGRTGASTTALMDQEATKKNIVFIDIGGFVKVVATGSPLYAGSLRRFPGFEDSTIMQPTAGVRGHLVFGMGIALRDNTMKADGYDNLFCAGTKSGESMCLMDAMVTGDLAGYNAVRKGVGQPGLELPGNLVAGAYIDLVGKAAKAGKQVERGYQGVIQIEFLKGMKVYHEGNEIVKEVDKVGLSGVYKTRLC